MEGDPSQTAPTGSGLPTVGSDASPPAIGDAYETALAAFEAQDGAVTPEADASAAAGRPAPDGTADEAAGAADGAAEADGSGLGDDEADEADLASYPEAVREQFRALDPEQRKALYEHAERRISDRLETEKRRNDELARTQAEAAARRAQIRSTVGRFVGHEPQTITLADGTQRALPAYQELDRLLRSPRGRAELENRYGLDQDQAEAVRAEWDDRNAMLEAAADGLELGRLAAFDSRLRDGIRAEGIDPSLLDRAETPEAVASSLIRHLKSEHQAEVAALKREHEARAEAQNLNAEGLRGRVLAATSRRLATGGRSGAGSGPTTVERLIEEAGSPEEYARRAAEGDYVGIELRS